MEEIEYEDSAAKEATDILLQNEFPQVPVPQPTGDAIIAHPPPHRPL